MVAKRLCFNLDISLYNIYIHPNVNKSNVTKSIYVIIVGIKVILFSLKISFGSIDLHIVNVSGSSLLTVI